MAVGEPSKRVSKLTIGFLKVIPMLLASITLLNQVFAFFYIELDILGYIGSVSLLPLIFLYLSSYCFKFCSYHRMFLHYVVICNILNMVREGKLPKGKKIAGFKELIWYKRDLNKYIKNV